MKTRFEDERQKARTAKIRTEDGEALRRESDPLTDGVRIFRDSIRASAERPDAFWTRQRAAIAEQIRPAKPVWKRRPVLLWAPVSVVVLACLFLFTEKIKLPAPDFAAGADQNLLVEVERALYRDCPEALAPAAALIQEIR